MTWIEFNRPKPDYQIQSTLPLHTTIVIDGIEFLNNMQHTLPIQGSDGSSTNNADKWPTRNQRTDGKQQL